MSYRQGSAYGRRQYQPRQDNQQREQRDNDGKVWLNTKSDNPNAPTFTGSGMIAGRMYWISAWEKRTKDGEVFFSLAFKPKDEQVREAPQRPAPQPQRTYAQRREPAPGQYDDAGGNFDPNVPPPGSPDDYGGRPY